MTTHTRHTAESLHALSDAEFVRVVAELAGWTDLQLYTDWSAVKHAGADMNVLHGYPRGMSENNSSLIEVPDYATDLNEAWALFGDAGELVTWEAGFAPSKGCMGRVIVLNEPCTDFKTYVEWHTQPARALSTAWALWKQDVEEVGT